VRQASPARLAAAGLAFAIVAQPLAAAERPQVAPAPQPGRIAASVSAAIATAESARPVRATQDPSPQTTGDEPFLKTGKGRFAIALLAIAAGYTIYSRFENRVQSPGR
jgi:hypothetical protein